MQETQEELSAWKFTPDSVTGKRLMAKCRQLLQENEEIGKMISSGRLAKLETELAMQKTLCDEMKKNQEEMDDFVQELDEDVEGMQSTIYYLQQQLKEAKETIAAYERQNRGDGAEAEAKTRVEQESQEEIVTDEPKAVGVMSEEADVPEHEDEQTEDTMEAAPAGEENTGEALEETPSKTKTDETPEAEKVQDAEEEGEGEEEEEDEEEGTEATLASSRPRRGKAASQPTKENPRRGRSSARGQKRDLPTEEDNSSEGGTPVKGGGRPKRRRGAAAATKKSNPDEEEQEQEGTE